MSVFRFRRFITVAGILWLLTGGVAGCHLVFPFNAEEPTPDAAGDGQADKGPHTHDLVTLPEAILPADGEVKLDRNTVPCPSLTTGYSRLASNGNGCSNKQSCNLFGGFKACLDSNTQYVVINHNSATGEMVTYGLCNADPKNGILRCMSGKKDVLRLNSAGADTLTGKNVFTGRWHLLHRKRSPLHQSGGCAQTSCELFAGTALQQPHTTRIHVRRIVDGVTQWFSWCKVGTENGRRVDCAALDTVTNERQGLTLFENKKEVFTVASHLKGTWSLFHVPMVLVKKASGCNAVSCNLMNAFSVAPDKVYAVVQYSTSTHHWFQLCEGSKVGTLAPQLRCYHRFPPEPQHPSENAYLTLDAAGPDTNQGSDLFNVEWILMQEP